MMKKSEFISMSTSSVRNNFSNVIDTVLGNERVMFNRYGKDKAALVTTDDADVISYLLEEDDYDRILTLAKKVRAKREEKDEPKKVNSR